MPQSIPRSILLGLSLCFFLSAKTQADEPQAAETARLLMHVIDTVVENHVEPPTRQQMVLEAIRYVATRKNQIVPAELSRRISSADAQSLETLLAEELSLYLKGGGSPTKIPDLPSPIAEYLAQYNMHVESQSEHRVQQSLAGNRYVGIGVMAGMHSPTDQFQFIKVVRGGAADLAGALDLDIVERVDGRPTAGKSLVEVIKWLRGEEGTKVTLVLRQPNQKESREYTMTRAVVPFTTVNPPDYSPDNRVVAIGFKNFSGSTVHELRKIEAELPDSVEIVTLDFRGLSGSNLQHGIMVANALVDGKPIGKVESTNGVRMVTAEPGTLFGDRKLMIVIDRSTQGTPYWVACAVKDNSQEETVFGESASPGLVQEGVPMEGSDYVIVMPTARLRRANGQALDSEIQPVFNVKALPLSRSAGQTTLQARQRLFDPPNAATDSPLERNLFKDLSSEVSRRFLKPLSTDKPKE